jgi:hypothetical protein
VAEIPIRKLKSGREKKSWPEEFMAKFWPNVVNKSDRKGAEETFLKKFFVLQ